MVRVEDGFAPLRSSLSSVVSFHGRSQIQSRYERRFAASVLSALSPSSRRKLLEHLGERLLGEAGIVRSRSSWMGSSSESPNLPDQPHLLK